MRKTYKQMLTMAVLSATISGTSWAATVPEAFQNAIWPNQSGTVSTNVLKGYENPEAVAIAKVESGAVQGDINVNPASVPAEYVSSITEEALAPYVGKRITAISVANVPQNIKQEVQGLLFNRVGDTVSKIGIDADIAALGNLGVFSEVNPIFKPVPEGVQIVYQVVPNPVVKAVDVKGSTIYPEKELESFLNIPTGKVFNTVYVGQRAQAINAAYNRDGYILAHVNDIHVDDNGVLHVNIEEGIVDKITVEGNKKTKDYVVTREMIQKTGTPLNKFLARRSLQRIYNLGYFSDVNMKLLPGEQPGHVTLQIDVVEQKTGVITVGAGYSKSNGFSGLLEVGENNFRGTGDKVNLHWEFGGHGGGANYAVSYTRPWLDDKATSLGVNLYNRRDAYTDYDGDGKSYSSYLRKSQGLSATLGRATGLFTRDYLTLETRKDKWLEPTEKTRGDYSGVLYGSYDGKPSKFAQQYPNYINDNFGRTNSITYQHVFDSRDNVYDPKHGKRYSYSVQLAGLGGDFRFAKVSGEARLYKALKNDHVIAFRVGAGMIKGDAAYSQLFAIGGSNTLRGYEDDQFRGEKFYNATLEYRIPLFKKVSGVAFVDIGGAWDTPNVPWYHNDHKFNVGYGPGLRIQTPIGPVRLDYGFGRDGGKFTFAFGGQF